MNQPLSVRLPEHIHVADIDIKAKALGMSRAAFVINAIEIILGLDVELYQEIERYSKGLRMPISLVMQSMITKRIAEEKAKDKVWGSTIRPLDEFQFIQDEMGPRPISYKELYMFLEEKYVVRETAEKERGGVVKKSAV